MKTKMRKGPYSLLALKAGLLACSAYLLGNSASAQPAWTEARKILDLEGAIKRAYLGPELWGNRSQDWSVEAGKVVSQPDGIAIPMRTAHLIAYSLEENPLPFTLAVELELGSDPMDGEMAGFLIGAGAGKLHYKAAALVQGYAGLGGGILALVEKTEDGLYPVFRDMGVDFETREYPKLEARALKASGPLPNRPIRLILSGTPQDDGNYTLLLEALDRDTDEALAQTQLEAVDPSLLRGGVALASHFPDVGSRHVFSDLRASEGRLERHAERLLSPIAGALYSNAEGVLKVGVQIMPYGEALYKNPSDREGVNAYRRPTVSLLARPAGSQENYRSLARPIGISLPDYHALFRIQNWDASQDWEALVVFTDERGTESSHSLFIRSEPAEADEIKFVGLSCMGVMGRFATQIVGDPKGHHVVGRWTPANMYFPFSNLTQSIAQKDPDIAVFQGDQIYEHMPVVDGWNKGSPYNEFLYKWLIWHWAFRDIAAVRPCLLQTDDHDVYQGNIWGDGGVIALSGDNRDGGYIKSSSMVNLVQRVMTGHNPDAYDVGPTPAGIVNYYSRFKYGKLDIALLEDRKFKTPPSRETESGELSLLGEGQMRMLKEWAEEKDPDKFNLVLSQTIYAGIGIRPQTGEQFSSTDTNGWPKAERDRAVELFSKAGAFIFSGDQHLTTLAKVYTGDEASYVHQFSTPAVGMIWWRWWYPRSDSNYEGSFKDSFGNRFEMLAAANPQRRDLMGFYVNQPSHLVPEELWQKGVGRERRPQLNDGFGMLRIDFLDRTVTVESWPYHTQDVSDDSQQFPGWPQTFDFPQN